MHSEKICLCYGNSLSYFYFKYTSFKNKFFVDVGDEANRDAIHILGAARGKSVSQATPITLSYYCYQRVRHPRGQGKVFQASRTICAPSFLRWEKKEGERKMPWGRGGERKDRIEKAEKREECVLSIRRRKAKWSSFWRAKQWITPNKCLLASPKGKLGF